MKARRLIEGTLTAFFESTEQFELLRNQAPTGSVPTWPSDVLVPRREIPDRKL